MRTFRGILLIITSVLFGMGLSLVIYGKHLCCEKGGDHILIFGGALFFGVLALFTTLFGLDNEEK